MMDVTLVRWPAESARREALVETSTPRLLLVEDGVAPPPVDDCLEDWIRVPADGEDVEFRVQTLAARSAKHTTPRGPDLDGDGVLRFAESWVALPPVEARITGALLERFGAVVSREALGKAAWPDGAPGRNALDVHVLRLRRRLKAVRLTIRTVRSRGYLLEPAQASSR
jgi:DNA-binding response OmpR family regulator